MMNILRKTLYSLHAHNSGSEFLHTHRLHILILLIIILIVLLLFISLLGIIFLISKFMMMLLSYVTLLCMMRISRFLSE